MYIYEIYTYIHNINNKHDKNIMKMIKMILIMIMIMVMVMVVVVVVLLLLMVLIMIIPPVNDEEESPKLISISKIRKCKLFLSLKKFYF